MGKILKEYKKENRRYVVEDIYFKWRKEMERTQIFLTKRQKKFFKKKAKKLEISYASLIRRVLDSYMERKENK